MKLVITDNLSFTDYYHGNSQWHCFIANQNQECHCTCQWMTTCQWWQVSWNAPPPPWLIIHVVAPPPLNGDSWEVINLSPITLTNWGGQFDPPVWNLATATYHNTYFMSFFPFKSYASFDTKFAKIEPSVVRLSCWWISWAAPSCYAGM